MTNDTAEFKKIKDEFREFLVAHNMFGKYSRELKKQNDRKFAEQVRYSVEHNNTQNLILNAFTWGKEESGHDHWYKLHVKWQERKLYDHE
jgi:hypothetical protein